MEVQAKARCLAGGVFSRLSEELRLVLAERMGVRDLTDGQTLFMSGEAGDEIYVVVSGALVIHQGATVLATTGPGELVGEMSVLGGGYRTAGARAQGATKLLFLKEKAIRLLICAHPEIAFAIFRVLIDRLTEANTALLLLSKPQASLGRLEVLAGDLKGRTFPIKQERLILGKSKGAGVKEQLNLLLPSSDPELKEEHAAVCILEKQVYVRPMAGVIMLHGQPLSEEMAVGPEDELAVGALRLRFLVTSE